ncbi:phosphotransferase [Streptomyces sp. NPDC051840]|uniref:phosphotransferase n=1 Tax=Streptomyces sp. NPDC051840 TaxID=3154752 RepID=UPI0034136EFB
MPVREKPRSTTFANLDERALGVIAERYRLRDVDCFLPILLDGNRCTLLEVRSETSKKVVVECAEERYFFKQIPWYCDTPEQVEVSTALQARLRLAGLPVPRLLPTDSGELWTVIGEETYVLFDFSHGLRYGAHPGQLTAAAATLGRLHRAAVHVPGAPGESVFRLAHDHLDLLGHVAGGEGRDLGSAPATLRALAEEAERRAGALGFGELPAVAVHGDYNPWNLLFDEDDAVTAVLDFDNSDVASRLHDLAEALLTFCVLAYREDSTNFARLQPPLPDGGRVTAFLTAYTAVAPLTARERDCLPWAVRAVLVELLALGLIRADLDPDGLPDLDAWLTHLDACLDGVPEPPPDGAATTAGHGRGEGR